MLTSDGPAMLTRASHVRPAGADQGALAAHGSSRSVGRRSCRDSHSPGERLGAPRGKRWFHVGNQMVPTRFSKQVWDGLGLQPCEKKSFNRSSSSFPLLRALAFLHSHFLLARCTYI